MPADRAAARAALAQILAAEVSAAQAVYAYQPGDFGGQSPVVCVSSGPIRRPPLSFRGGQAALQLVVDVFVLYADEGAGYTEADAEDALDQVEHQVAGVVARYQEAGAWNTLDYAGDTTVDFLTIGGVPYKHERIPLAALLFS